MHQAGKYCVSPKTLINVTRNKDRVFEGKRVENFKKCQTKTIKKERNDHKRDENSFDHRNDVVKMSKCGMKHKRKTSNDIS